MSHGEVDDFKLCIQTRHHLRVRVDHLALAQGLLHQASGRVFLLVAIGALWHKVWVTAEELTSRRNDPSGVLRTAHLEILAMDLDLLQHEGLSSLFCRAEICESVVSLTSDPAPDNWVTILKNADRLAELFERAVQKLHQLLRGEVLRNVANVQLALRLVMVGEIRLRLLVAIGAQDFSRAHLHLLLLLWLHGIGRRLFIEAT